MPCMIHSNLEAGHTSVEDFFLNTYHSKPDLPQHIRNVTPGHCLVAFRFQDNKNLSCVSYESVLCVITHKTKMCG